MPMMASAFNSLDEQSWIATAYLLTSTVFQPFFERACDFFGCKLMLFIPIGIFEFGSLMTTTVQNFIWLCCARAVTGIGGAGLMSLLSLTMGQAASRNRAQTPAPLVDSTPSKAGTSTAASSLRTASRATKRYRTSSLCQSVLGLLPHSCSSSSLNSNPSSYDGAQDAQPPKKQWRSSKRWSKAPAMSSDESTAVESTLTPAVEEEVPVVMTSPYTPPPEELPHAETDLASEPKHWNGSTLQDEHESYKDNGEPAQPTPASEQAPRPYPQPGTLVVMQGVVNTTDSQANGTSTPQ
ncbi:hypothetical protein WOLCODRAFT_159415 [Wolfiporia cocos MD-104 SS10]|uniref:Major facilitator superfamily (MFS) profile domain-containing protein n=1 Tax=Wolfiporia cocos (strain MD-104) TaxID=742152 RepID=A0A2H3JRQ3_WOLCO|nr:hypothetical protein WOLCODRAFT_159415 [Wolfiporia cocos MD-104 SS10]